MAEHPTSDKDEHQVLRFRPRNKLAGPIFRLPGASASQNEPVEDLSKFERGEDGADDFRHRMIINGVALGFTVMLIVGGIWIVNTLADMRKNTDCYLSGQRRCTPINAPPTERY